MPLMPTEKYELLRSALDELPINVTFCWVVVDGLVDGEIIVDNLIQPKCFYIYNNYGISLIYCPTGANNFLEEVSKIISTRVVDEWLQIWPASLQSSILILLNTDRVKQYRRQNFVFNLKRFKSLNVNLCDYDMVEITRDMYESMHGDIIPSLFWRNVEQFTKIGKGFAVILNDILISFAFSAFMHDRILEIGIETVPTYRGQGYATIACTALINYCAGNNFTPVWSCRYENIESLRLAEKLGFEPTLQVPYIHIVPRCSV